MASDAKHKEADHHSTAGKHQEVSHKDLIHHANGVPQAKPEHHAAAKGLEEHAKKSPAGKEHVAASKPEHVAKKGEHALPHLVVEKSHAQPPKGQSEAKSHSGDKAKPHAEAKTAAEIKHLEAVRNQLQAKFAKEGETVVVQEKSHVAGKSVTLEAKAVPVPAHKPVEAPLPAPAPKISEVRSPAPAPVPVDSSTYHAVTSYLASTSVVKAIEGWSSAFSHQSEAKAAAPEVAPAHNEHKSKAALELEALQRGDCGGARTPIIENWITRNEVAKHTYTAYTPNDNNTGIAVGELQWNQKKGSLPDLLRAWHHEDAPKFDQIFGKYSKDLLSNQYVKKADFNGIPELLNGMHTALADKDFQGVQDSLRQKQIYHYCEVAHSFGFNSIRGEGYVADAANQKGLGPVEHILAGIDAEKYTQSQRIDMFRERTDIDRQNGKARNERVSRGSKAVYTVVENLRKQVQLASNQIPGR